MIAFKKYRNVLILATTLLFVEQVFCQAGNAVEKQEAINRIAEVMIPKGLIDATLMNILQVQSSNTNFDQRFAKYKNFDRKAVGEAFYLNLGSVMIPNGLIANSADHKINPVLAEKLMQAHKQFLSSNFSLNELRQIAEFAQTPAGKKILAPNNPMAVQFAATLRDIDKWIGDEAEKATVNQLGLKP